MPEGKRFLSLGKILSMGESKRHRFEVRAACWMDGTTGKPITHCLVVVQYRLSGEVQRRPFSLVIEPDELGTVLEGVNAWTAAERTGTLGRLFASSVADE